MTGDQRLLDLTSKLTERLDINLALQAAGLGVWEVDLMTNQVQWDSRCGELFGLTQDHHSYTDTLRFIHPEDLIQVTEAIQWATNPKSGGHYEQTYRTLGEDGHTRWIRSVGRSYFTETGQPIRFAGIAQDVTPQVQDRQQAQQSEARFRTLIEEAPVATCLFVGPDMCIEIANQAMIQVWGKGPAVIGLPLAEALPELKNQHFLTTLDALYATGNSYQARGGRADLVVEGRLQTFYFDYDFKPLRTPQGEVYAILETATDVTQQVLAQKRVEQSQAQLQSIIDLAELGSYRIELPSNRLYKSPRVAQWYGLPEVTDVSTSISVIQESDRDRVGQVLADALEPGSAGTYQIEYTIINAQTGHARILRTNGQVLWNEEGQPVRIDGAVMDITTQRVAQLALEDQVQQRTQELAAANEELAAINEEYAATNEELSASNEEYAAIIEELEEANSLLNRSNDNLQQFAYVASHDLQEPLRKIQQFGDLLRSQYGPYLGNGIDYLQRIQLAGSRMSTLIKDLLTFSRISTQRETEVEVPLTDTVQRTLTDLELVIEETGAIVHLEPLPTITGDPLQLGQLFQNLLSNALKFRRVDEAGVFLPPEIWIRASWLAADHLPEGIKPPRRSAAYHRVEVVDNGIGFDAKYADRIFQVFQRLHGKSNYAGTGIGLAICEKVVLNHGGAITASSQPGQGATFTVYLPM